MGNGQDKIKKLTGQKCYLESTAIYTPIYTIHATMSFFSPADLAIFAEASAVAKKQADEKRLVDFAGLLFKRIMSDSRDNHGAIMKNLTENISIGQNQVILWECRTTKFNRSEINRGRDCRDEMMVHPVDGRRLSHRDYAIEMGQHYTFGMKGDYSVHRILKNTLLVDAISAELGPNFICQYRSVFLERNQSGLHYLETITAIYCAKGRSEAEEAAVQKARAEFPIGSCCDCGKHFTSLSVVNIHYGKDINSFCSPECAAKNTEDDYDY